MTQEIRRLFSNPVSQTITAGQNDNVLFTGLQFAVESDITGSTSTLSLILAGWHTYLIIYSISENLDTNTTIRSTILVNLLVLQLI
ncbi:hypothetical protein QJS64_07960 [Paraclostridium bifermentans]|uniref:Uncharacterized protein n=1 Tax=Paraclostridium bifermentans TaxID=1490 RepID=A0ABY8R7A2_PARBF|nr:hypothetical protein QJS64_07960 [Paraclostridium bifermentans]